MTPDEYVPAVSRASSAPVYAPYETFLGLGIVGGFMDSFQAQGTAVADLAIDLLAGGPASTPRGTNAAADVVDWRELKRRGLAEANLPPGAIVRFRDPTLWEEHRDTVLWTIAAFAVQSAVVVVMMIQIRRRRRAEHSLLQSEERMAFAAASVNVGLWQYYCATDSIWATDHCRKMFDIPSGQRLSPEAFLQPVHSDDRSAARHWLRSLSQSRSPVVREMRIVREDGQIVWYAACGQARFDDQGKAVSISGIFSDITPRKQIESEADSQRQTLAHMTRVSVLGELSGAIAHEINQPLTAILSNAQAAHRMLSKQPPDLAEVGEALDDIIREDSRASEVIRRLRGMLRKEKGKVEQVVLNDLVQPALQLVNSELARRGIGVKLALADHLPAVAGDPVQLQQVLINLVMNAMDAVTSPQASQRTIAISTRVSYLFVEIVVADRGPGLKAGQEALVLEPFYTTKEHGLGLGLAICSSIARAHGGLLQLSNGEGGGACARLTLPVTKVASVAA
jgi:C4-dicarboxylate-specific signal transduction histidine kinase